MAGILHWLLLGLSFLLLILPTCSTISVQTCRRSSPSSCCIVNNTAITFDSNRHICCQGKLNPRDDPNKLYCCGQALYSPASSICCNDVISHVNASNTKPKCCGNVGYDAERLFCCQGVVRKKTVGNPGCCAGKELDVNKQICCKGSIQSSTEGRSSCCGAFSYNPHKDTCCNSVVLYVNANTRTCCGSLPFNPSLSTCCRGQLSHKPGLSCCHKSAYNQTTHLCCGEKVKAKDGKNSRCCSSGNSWALYDKDNQTCCAGKVLSKQGHLACCGKDVYDVTLQVCCGETPLGTNTPINWRCCGGKPYNEDHQICCKNNIHPKESRRTRCCGNKGYEPSRFQCEDFLFSRISPIKGDYCGGKLYSSDRELCCKNTIFRKVYGWLSQCCGQTIYNRQTKICCDGQLAPVPSGLPQCCRTRPINIFQQKCDLVTGDVASRSRPHVKFCGSKMVEYDSRKSKCCGDVTYSGRHICCQGKVKRLPGNGVGNFKCCDEKPHNNSFLCCNGNPVSKEHATACCGRSGYNSSTHACCQGKVYEAGYTCCKGVVHPTPGTKLGKGNCCGGIGYNNNFQICCQNVVFPKTSKKMKCCGGRPYDMSRNLYICCNGSLSLSCHGRNTCCGKESFNQINDTCCRGQVHRGKKQSCCGKNSYDTSKEICCGRIVYPVAKYGDKCCRKLAYNDTQQICQKGKLMTKILCGRKYYDDVTHECCGDRVYVKSHRYKCCSRYHFNPLKSICCGNKVYPKTKTCCNGRPYNRKFGCCGGEVYKKKSATQCCDGKKYDRRKLRCKKQRIVAKDRLKRKLCGVQNNVAFVGKVVSVKKHSFMVVQILKGKQIQVNYTLTIPRKQLRNRKVTGLAQGKDYLVIGRLHSKSPSTVRHVKMCQPWNNKQLPKIQAILKSCNGNAGRSRSITKALKYVNYNRFNL